MNLSLNKKGIILFFFVIIFFIELTRTAWITDDAIITLRTVLNFINGYGLVFNVGERVQAYTHPLWFMLISVVSLISGNIFIATFILSFLTTLLTLLLLFCKISKNSLASFLAIEVIIFSKAFLDFSTSGLENPLSHLLIIIAIYFTLKLQKQYNSKLLFSYLLTCVCLYLTRPDLIIIFVPLTLAVFIQYRENYKSLFKMAFVAAIPALVWTLFSLFYYGFPFPNTAYAKLGAGIELADRIQQGGLYFLDSLQRDPITLTFVSIGILYGLTQSNYCKLLTLGTILYLCYIVSIGGDFMSGRFFTAPLLISLTLITLTHFHKIIYIVMALVALKLGVDNIQNTLLSNKSYENTNISFSGIGDERGVYFQSLGLISNTQSVIFFEIPKWQINSARKFIISCGLMGLTGIKGGPNLHIIDQCALADPLLARLPAKYSRNWRIGHFYRQLPDGYIETITHQKNLLVDPKTREFYDYIQLITQGNLIDLHRMKGIVYLNLGAVNKPDTDTYKNQSIKYSPVITDYAHLHNKTLDLTISLDDPGNLFFLDQVLIKLPSPQTIKSTDLILSYSQYGYNIKYLANHKVVFSTTAKPPIMMKTPMAYYNLVTPSNLPKIDTISISPVDENLKTGHAIGYIEIN